MSLRDWIRWTLESPGDVRDEIRAALCRRGAHWPIIWSDYAYPGSSDPPHPPEPGWLCNTCGDADWRTMPYRYRIRERLTPLWWIEQRVRRQDHRDGLH